MNKAEYKSSYQGQPLMCTVDEACGMFRLSRGQVMRLAKEKNAIMRIGRSLRIIVPKIMN